MPKSVDSDEVHDGSIYSLSIPAHWHYEKMGRASEGNHTNKNLLSHSAGSVITYGKGANPIKIKSGSSDQEPAGWSINPSRVVSASANTYSTMSEVTSWMNENVKSIYAVNSIPDIKKQELETIWRPYRNYTFKGQTTNSSLTKNTAASGTPLNRIYEGGLIDSFVPFNYSTDTQDKKWVRVNEVTKYSPHGNALEERNVLDVYSAAKFGYNYTQPIMIASNALYDEIYFEDYENERSKLTGLGHSGKKSLAVGANAEIVSNVYINGTGSGGRLVDDGAYLKLWVSQQDRNAELQVEALGSRMDLNKIAQVGQWTLYSVYLSAGLFNQGQTVSIRLLNNRKDGKVIYVDDVKFQPKESQSTCYVYDVKSLRMITQFDDQHFGLVYQYDGEGKLVRKLIETERGLKTISETQYNTPRDER